MHFRNYINSNWCRKEFSLGHVQAIEGRPKFIILILMDDVTVADLPDEMRDFIKIYTYIEANDMNLFRKKLRNAMPKTALRDKEREVEMKVLNEQVEHEDTEVLPVKGYFEQVETHFLYDKLEKILIYNKTT